MKLTPLRALLSMTVINAVTSQVHAAPDPVMTQLIRQLEARDALIRDLQERVTQLEQARQPSSTPAPSQAPPPPNPTPSIRPPPAPWAVDEAAAERALERSLTQNGALLLPSRVAELQFNGGLVRNEQATPTLVTQGAQVGVGTIKSQRTDVVTSLAARIGLPHDTQLELSLPYRRSEQSTSAPVSFSQFADTSVKVSGWDDLTLGLASTLRRERDGWPDVIGRVSWNTGRGDEALGEHFQSFRGGLTLLKRQDPLVFTGTMYVERARVRDGLQPGRQLGLSVGALLAASPQTSLSMGLDQVITQAARVEGTVQPGGTQLSSMLTLGTATALNKRTLLSFSLGVGLTRDAPKYVLGVSLPVRFDLLN